MIDTSNMTSEEKKKFDFEIAAGMRDRITGELYAQYQTKASIEEINKEVEPKKRGRPKLGK